LAAGVNVYVVVFVLSRAGLQLPVMLFSDVVGKAVNVVPSHIAGTEANVGVTFGFTTMVSIAVVAHWPLDGVNVYVVVAVLFNAGDQVPVMPFCEVVGKGDSVSPEQIGATVLNVGVMTGSIFTVVVAVTPGHPLASATLYVTV
jgi:hypothetical protein